MGECAVVAGKIDEDYVSDRFEAKDDGDEKNKPVMDSEKPPVRANPFAEKSDAGS